MNNKYVGNRYVPKLFVNPNDGSCTWINTVEHESLTVVMWQGKSYTSRKKVPIGIDISNNEYWVNTADYNAQVAIYEQNVRDYHQYLIDQIEIINNDNGEFKTEQTLNYNNFITNINNKINDLCVNVKFFGAIGDGIHDDTESIQNAINNMMNGGKLFFPSGNYLVTQTINGISNIDIVGVGNSSKIFTNVGSVDNGLNVLVFTEKENFSVANLCVESSGYGENYPTVGTFTGMGSPILIIGCKNFTIKDCFVNKGGKYYPSIISPSDPHQGVGNIYLSSCRDGIITNNHITKCANGICVDDWYSKNVGKENLYCKNIIIESNTVNDGSGTGIVIDTDPNIKTNNVIVTNNVVSNMGFCGLEMKGCSHSIFTNNIVNGNSDERTWGDSFVGRKSTMNGFRVVGSRDCEISCNKFIDLYEMGGLVHSSRNIVIKENNISIASDSDYSQQNGLLFYSDNVTDFGNLKICDNEIIVTSDNGNNVSIDMTNATNTLDIDFNNNYIIGKKYGLFIFGSNKVNNLNADSNKFSDGNTFKLTAFNISYARQINISNHIASYIIRFLYINSATTLILNNNNLDTISFPYKLLGAIDRFIVKDFINNTPSGFLFDCDGSTITYSDCSGTNILNLDLSKYKNTIHPQKYVGYNNSPYVVGTWSIGDKIINSIPTVGNPISWVYGVNGGVNAWISEGNL